LVTSTGIGTGTNNNQPTAVFRSQKFDRIGCLTSGDARLTTGD
jgi:hypothetical protein